MNSFPLTSNRIYLAAHNLFSARNELEHSGQKILVDGQNKVQSESIPVKTVLKHGSISTSMISITNKEKIDFIVIWERGLGAVARFFLGSIAKRALRLVTTLYANLNS